MWRPCKTKALAAMLWSTKQESHDFSRVECQDVEGDVIYEYTGKIDITYDDSRILFDDEAGLRHIIYYSTGTVIVEELEQPK